MADEEKIEASAAPAKSSKMLLIVILLLVVVGGGGAAYFLMFNKKAKPAAEDDGDGQKVGPVVAMKSFIINLDEPGGSRYLKLAIDLEMRKPLTEEQSRMTVRVRDKIIVYLSGLRIADVQKRDAKLKLKAELVKLANQAYRGKRVRDVYFKEFVIQ